jgi:putative molybdopterin biosynthesis protein
MPRPRVTFHVTRPVSLVQELPDRKAMVGQRMKRRESRPTRRKRDQRVAPPEAARAAWHGPVRVPVAQSADYPQAATHLASPPPVIAGSHDPLLEWSVRESGCELAILVAGSTAGMHHLLAGQAVACGLHLTDPTTGEYETGALTSVLPGLDFVVIEWAKRQQGLVLAPGNQAKIGSIADLRKRGVRVATRQPGSGTALLLSKLLGEVGLSPDDLKTMGRPLSSHTDVADAIRQGKADVGLAIEAVAREQGLDFLPLLWEPG